MKPLLVVVTSYLLMITVSSQMAVLTPFADVLLMFSLAFFDNLLGKKKTVIVVATFSLLSMTDESVPWAASMLRSIMGNLCPPPLDIEFRVYAFLTIFVTSSAFFALLGWNLFQLYFVKYLVRRWKLKERCGIMARSLS